MHSHCEIIVPSNADIEAAVSSIMGPFYEGDEDSTNGFWDFYSIGGRWSGAKLMAQYDDAKIDEFRKWCSEEGITVSRVQFGKQELSPASQIPKVDAKWNEMFPPPDGKPIPCPIFKHSGERLPGDVLPLGDVGNVQCERVIFAGPSWDRDSKAHAGPLEATFMLVRSDWNGVNHMPVAWDGTIESARRAFVDKLRNYKDEYREQITPRDDWLAVTIDYHS